MNTMLRATWWLTCGFLVAVRGVAQTTDDAAIRRAVVKVWATQSPLNLSNPWQRSDGREVSGSGVWLGERRVLTNAHVVERATQAFIQTSESSDRIPVTVKVASPELDLAILELENDEPFDGVQPPGMVSTIPRLRTTVRVYGYPEGGTTLSVTEGIISRIEFLSYSFGVEALRIQIDAAINHGNSGGPAIVDGKVVGIAFQKRASADNIGYLIPSEEVERFLADVVDGKYDGKQTLQFGAQRLQNKALREKLAVAKDVTGLLIRDLKYHEGNSPLQIGDIVTHIGDHEIDNSGVSKLNDEIKVDFKYFTAQLQKDGKIPLKVLRNGFAEEIEMPLLRAPLLLLRELKGDSVEWFVHGPYVYTEATTELIRGIEAAAAVGDDRSRITSFAWLQTLGQRNSPLVRRRSDKPAFDGEQLVLVANTLPHRIHTGYASPQFQTVKQINGTDVKNLKHMAELIRDCKEEFITITYFDRDSETHIFRRSELEASTQEVMDNVGIPRRGSPALVEVWEKKGTS